MRFRALCHAALHVCMSLKALAKANWRCITALSSFLFHIQLDLFHAAAMFGILPAETRSAGCLALFGELLQPFLLCNVTDVAGSKRINMSQIALSRLNLHCSCVSDLKYLHCCLALHHVCSCWEQVRCGVHYIHFEEGVVSALHGSMAQTAECHFSL